MPTPSDAISTYIHAKDGNRPYSLRRAFAETVALEMNVKTEAISFPASAESLDSITNLLVHRFAREFENVYTFCLASPAGPELRQLRDPMPSGVIVPNEIRFFPFAPIHPADRACG